MKYAGNITILDDQGNTVFERDLSSDEIVEALLHENKSAQALEPDVPKAVYKPKFNTRIERGIKPCCGSMGQRHKNDCPEKAKSSDTSSTSSDTDTEPSTHVTLTESLYEQVKELRVNTEKTSLAISQELELPLQQVNYAVLAPTYEKYLENAKRQSW